MTPEERQKQLADMQCWVFRMAQQKWHKSPSACADLFEQHRLLKFMDECYEILHQSGYAHVVCELEQVLQHDGVTL